MKTFFTLTLFSFFLCLLTGCATTYNVSRANTAGEGTVVFVRPDSYSILGTRSIRDHIEITYERLTILPNGFAQLEIGIRNRGGQHWWDTKGKGEQLSATPHFYANPIPQVMPSNGLTTDLTGQGNVQGNLNTPPVYTGPRTPVRIELGETTHLKFLCPVRDVQGYQVVLSEK